MRLRPALPAFRSPGLANPARALRWLGICCGAALALQGLDAAAQPAPDATRAAPASQAAAAPQVGFNGKLGNRALLVIGGQPRTLGVGESFEGVRLLSLKDDTAQVLAGGQRLNLRLGAAPVSIGGAAGQAGSASGRRVVLTADLGGHFYGSGTINGRVVRFMVDTGATVVALSQAEADRIGLPFRDAPRAMANTANGEVPVHRVMLQQVRLGDVQVPMVEAVVMPAAMPHVLLGNSFLQRFQMKRENDVMTLERKD